MLDVHAPTKQFTAGATFSPTSPPSRSACSSPSGWRRGWKLCTTATLFREARENIRVEIKQNEDAAKQNIGYVQTDADSMTQQRREGAAASRQPPCPRPLQDAIHLHMVLLQRFGMALGTRYRSPCLHAHRGGAEVCRHLQPAEHRTTRNRSPSSPINPSWPTPFFMEEHVSDFRPEEIQYPDARVRFTECG